MAFVVSIGVGDGAARAQPVSTDWRDYIAGPASCLVEPVAVSFTENNDGGITDPQAVLVEDGVSVVFTRTGDASPLLAIDFGLPVSGKIEIVFGSTVSGPLSIAFSQRFEFLDIGSDTNAYDLGDLTVTGRPGAAWRTEYRRSFRYVLLYLPGLDTVDVDAIRVCYTPYLGTADTYQGHFLCDNDLFNRIWYGCIYTVELCTTSGVVGKDGPWLIEEGMLSIYYEGGSEFGFTVDGSQWGDYTLDFDFRIMPLGRVCGWAFRGLDADNTYMWQIVAAEGGSTANTLRKHVRRNGAWESISSVDLPFPVAEGELHHVRSELDSSTIRTWLDGELIDTTVDETFSQGRIGFRASGDGEHFHVDNVVVADDSSGVLFSDSFDVPHAVPDPSLWERGKLLTILDGAKRDRAWYLGDFYPAQRSLYVAHFSPEIVAGTLRDAAEHQYDQALEDQYGGILRGKIPASRLLDYMTEDEWHSRWLDDYALWWVLTLHHHWMRTGDLAFVEEMYPALVGLLDDWCARKMRSDGLINLDQGDWYWSMTRSGGTTSFNALYVQALRCGSEMAGALGYGARADNWSARADVVVGAMNTWLYDYGQGLYYDGTNDHGHYPLDANMLAILYGIADDAKVASILDQIQSRMWSALGTRCAWPVYDTWGHRDQVWAWYVQYEAEARFRHCDDLRGFEAIRRPWQHMVEHDPGRTVWELIDASGGLGMGFWNTDHAFSSGAAWLMSEYVAGIRPTSPGFATFDVIPHPGGLNRVQCAMPTPQGGISVEYSLDRGTGTFDLDIDVPVGTIARVAVPRLDDGAHVTLDGEPVWKGVWPLDGATSDEHYLYFPDIDPGPHTLSAVFTARLVAPDFDFDTDVDMEDLGHLQACLTGQGVSQNDPFCRDARLDSDEDVDPDDLQILLGCLSGASIPADPACDD
jgi:hypothetical protein